MKFEIHEDLFLWPRFARQRMKALYKIQKSIRVIRSNQRNPGSHL